MDKIAYESLASAARDLSAMSAPLAESVPVLLKSGGAPAKQAAPVLSLTSAPVAAAAPRISKAIKLSVP